MTDLKYPDRNVLLILSSFTEYQRYGRNNLLDALSQNLIRNITNDVKNYLLLENLNKKMIV